jgi:hypothetical protein
MPSVLRRSAFIFSKVSTWKNYNSLFFLYLRKTALHLTQKYTVIEIILQKSLSVEVLGSLESATARSRGIFQQKNIRATQNFHRERFCIEKYKYRPGLPIEPAMTMRNSEFKSASSASSLRKSARIVLNPML